MTELITQFSLICVQTYVVVSILLLGIVIAKCCSGEHSPADYTKTRSRLLQLLPNEGGVGGEEAGNDYPINPLIRDGQKKVSELVFCISSNYH